MRRKIRTIPLVCVVLVLAMAATLFLQAGAVTQSEIDALKKQQQASQAKQQELKEQLEDAAYAERHIPFAGEIYMGHLRYSTTGKSGLSYVHPFLRRNNWRAKNLCICANFNMTNVDEIFGSIAASGQHPRNV